MNNQKNNKMWAGTKLIVLIGIVSLFSDFTYEGARSIIPQYFTTVLGGSVFLLGVVIGVGDFLGYAFRLVSGRIADRTRNYWGLIFVGYALNMIAVPLLALSGNYIIAALLIFAERMGRATRVPPRDYVISMASKEGGMGKGFAIQQILDQIGAVLGPLFLSLIIFLNYGYRDGFALLAIPAVLSLSFVVISYKYYKKMPQMPRKNNAKNNLTKKQFLMYSAGVGLSAAGLYHVAFILYGSQQIVATFLIPMIFVMAMAGEGLFGFLFGLLYDKVGRKLVFTGLFFTALIPLILFNSSMLSFFIAALFYGASLGIQDTVMRAVVGEMVHESKRGSAFGIFNAIYGFGIMFSGIIIGHLYFSTFSVIAYVLIMQLFSTVVIYISFRK